MTESSGSSDIDSSLKTIGRTLLSLESTPEESPDRKGHPAVESTDGSNLMDTVTENKPPERVRVKPRGKSSRRRMATCGGDGTRACKTKYTGTPARVRGLPALFQGVGCVDK